MAEFGADTGPGEVDPERFVALWAHRAPSTWNVSLDAVRSAAAYWQQQGWLAADLSRLLERRKPRLGERYTAAKVEQRAADEARRLAVRNL